jgi:putative transposase
LVEAHNTVISVARQCELLGVNRSSYYYTPALEGSLNLELMRLIDIQYTRTPFYGVRKLTEHFRRSGYRINRKRISRLMHLMALQGVSPKPSMSRKHPEHKIYPYLLREVNITDCNQVWCTDITYIRLKRGFLYLAAIMDWFSRFVIAWRLSNTLDVYFCLEMLHEALQSGQPLIFNSDQGVQFTSNRFTGILEDRNIEISMDGRGRCFDNIFIERLWRSVKYEEVYLQDYQTPQEAYSGLDQYFRFYNQERIHESLKYRTPAEVYMMGKNGFFKA